MRIRAIIRIMRRLRKRISLRVRVKNNFKIKSKWLDIADYNIIIKHIGKQMD